MRRVLTTAILLQMGCIAGALPGARFEAAPAPAGPGPDASPRLRYGAGVHVASFADTPVDVGLGYQAEQTLAPDLEEDERERARPAPQTERIHGPYAEVSARVYKSGHLGSYVGFRGSVLYPDGRVSGQGHVLTLAARWDIEFGGQVHGAGAASDQECGAGIGAATGRFAIGGFFEAGFRREDTREGYMVTAGITVRTPAIIGAYANPCAALELLAR